MTDITQESLQKKQEAIDLLAKRYRGLEQRTEALKSYGNAIVPQVMYEIFRAIEIVEQQNNEL